MLRIGLNLLATLILVGCQASQSPGFPTSKDIRVNIQAEGDVRLEIHYHQSTDAELGGGNISSPKLDNKLDVKLPGL